jgi:hypothetical protein
MTTTKILRVNINYDDIRKKVKNFQADMLHDAVVTYHRANKAKVTPFTVSALIAKALNGEHSIEFQDFIDSTETMWIKTPVCWDDFKECLLSTPFLFFGDVFDDLSTGDTHVEILLNGVGLTDEDIKNIVAYYTEHLSK